MTTFRTRAAGPLALAAGLILAAPSAAFAQATKTAPAAPHKAPVARGAKKPAPPPKPVEPPPPAEADAAQLDAAERVYYGVYECEFKQSIDIVASPRYKGYVDVKHLKSLWLMKPVLSSTGAIRLEDVGNETLMVQISAKSMLLNVRTGHRIVDECITARQRELVEAARAAKAAEVAAAAAASAAAASAASATADASPSAGGPAPAAIAGPAVAATTPSAAAASAPPRTESLTPSVSRADVAIPTPVLPGASSAR